MLVLSRKIGESVQLGDDITIMVVDIIRGRVKLGFTAPDSVGILRTELLEVREGTSDEKLSDLRD